MINKLDRDIGEKITKLRKDAKESQEDLSYLLFKKSCGNYISRYERGAAHFTADILKTLADHYNTSVDYLLGRQHTDYEDMFVLKCRDCRYYEQEGCPMGISEEDDYCSMGERK